MELTDLVMGDAMLLILSCDMFPGIFAVDGVRASRGPPVGGRGAGPGFIN